MLNNKFNNVSNSLKNALDRNWQRSDFHFELPENLIAQQPTSAREASRLLVVMPNSEGNGSQVDDKKFTDFIDYLQPNDLLIVNDTRVIPARLLGNKETGGKVEVLVERVLDNKTVLAHVRSSKSPKPGTNLLLESVIQATVLKREEDLFVLEFNHLKENETALSALEQHGHIPLPPYIERQDNLDDRERYQTVYAAKPGAAAAPTAGLHFTNEILNAIKVKGIETAAVTLHVGAGTFQPVRVDNLNDHIMHSEWVSIDKSVVEKIIQTKKQGGRVVAIGTTSVRCLESAFAQHGELQAYSGETDIFITPGFEFKVVDALLTNFHLSESTLIMLVSAFAGYDTIMSAYQHAIEQQYRFFSYGDAMFITRKI